MRLLYLYFSKATGKKPGIKWDPEKETDSPNIKHYITDGYVRVFNELLKKGILDEVKIFLEVGKLNGCYKISSNHIVYVMPRIDAFPQFVKPGDVIFVRGGFRWWQQYLDPFRDTNWFIYYGAAVPRSNWKIWHVVLHDLIDKPIMGRHHPRIPFTKPINCAIFKPRSLKKQYDIILNSCFSIYDRKGQWKVINAAVEYKKLYGKSLKIFMPGGTIKAEKTQQMPDIIRDNGLEVDMPGVISRDKLALAINKSKIYVHVGKGEQHARSALEAMRSGLPLFIHCTKQWAPFVSNNSKVTRIYKGDTENPVALAKALHQMLQDVENGLFKGSVEHFRKNNRTAKTINEFEKLLNIMKEHPKPDVDLICENYQIDKNQMEKK